MFFSRRFERKDHCSIFYDSSLHCGVTLVLILNLVSPPSAGAQSVTADQRACLNAFAKDFTKTATIQGKELRGCLRDFAKGRLLGTAEACLTADRRGKVGRGKDKSAARFAKNCAGSDQGGGARLASFGMRAAAVANTFAVVTHTTLADRVFAADLDTSLLADQTGARCQQAVVKNLAKCHATILKAYARCAKKGLKEGSVIDAAGLETCIGEDSGGKIARSCGAGSKLEGDLTARCAGVDLLSASPACGASDAATLHTCLEREARCTACLALDEVGDLYRDCDTFDDAAANGSCSPLTFPGTSLRFHPGHYLLESGPSISQLHLDQAANNPNVRGISTVYEWVNIEGDQPGSYDFSAISAALAAVKSINRRLMIMIRDKSFSGNPFIPVPFYMRTPEYSEGYLGSDQSGYIAKRWVPAVNARFVALIEALGAAFANDPCLEVVKTSESAAGPASALGPEYSDVAYATALMNNVDALADFFPNTTTALYLNWLPGNTPAMLDAITAHAQSRHVGIGGPDVRPDLAIEAYPYYPGYHGKAPIMVEVQWSNFDHTVPPGDTDALLRFAIDNLWVNYIAWLPRPGFESNVLATVTNLDFTAEFPVDPTR